MYKDKSQKNKLKMYLKFNCLYIKIWMLKKCTNALYK